MASVAPSARRRASSSAVYGGAQTRNTTGDGLGLSVQVYEAYDDNVLAGTTGSATTRPSLFQPNRVSIRVLLSGFSTDTPATAPISDRGQTARLPIIRTSRTCTAIYHQLGLAFSAPLGGRVSYARETRLPTTRRATRCGCFRFWRQWSQHRGFPYRRTRPRRLRISITLLSSATAYRYGGNVGLNVSVTEPYLALVSTTATLKRLPGWALRHAGSQRARRSLGYKDHEKCVACTAGYSRHEGKIRRSGPARPHWTENVDVGVDYDKPLSITRRTSCSSPRAPPSPRTLTGIAVCSATGSAILVAPDGPHVERPRRLQSRSWLPRRLQRADFVGFSGRRALAGLSRDAWSSRRMPGTSGVPSA